MTESKMFMTPLNAKNYDLNSRVLLVTIRRK